MYLASEPKDLKDFFQATRFLPPNGYDVEYFIVPANAGFQLPKNSGFVPEARVDPGAEPAFMSPPETIVYSRQRPVEKISQERSPEGYSDKPRQLPRTAPVSQDVIPSTDTLSLGSPFVRKISESRDDETVVLRKRYGPFPRNTLFHFVRKP